MATPKTMRLVSNEPRGARGRLIELESESDVGFKGGQFLIVDTGLRKEDGAPLKRCYSILSADSEQRRIEIAVQRVGAGSRALQELGPGAAVSYSGPWGKLLATSQEATGPAWVVATDTGITAALGLVRGRAFAPHLPLTTLVWFDHSADALLSPEDVEERLPEGLTRLERHELPAVGSDRRLDSARDRLRTLAASATSLPTALWLVGDGEVLFTLRDEAGRLFGVDTAEGASIECFFNNPDRVLS